MNTDATPIQFIDDYWLPYAMMTLGPGYDFCIAFTFWR